MTKPSPSYEVDRRWPTWGSLWSTTSLPSSRWALAAAALFALLPLMRTAEVPSPGITEWPESELPVVADLPDECELEHEPLEVCEA